MQFAMIVSAISEKNFLKATDLINRMQKTSESCIMNRD